MPFVYILKSIHYTKTYVGSTSDLSRRFKEHNYGISKYTRNYKPWQLIYKEQFANLADARQREKYFKTSSGRRFIQKLLIPR